MDKAERNKIIDEVIDAVKEVVYCWCERDSEYVVKRKELYDIAEKLKSKSIPRRAIQTPFWDWICPYCREGIGLENECSNCGQKILWGSKVNSDLAH